MGDPISREVCLTGLYGAAGHPRRAAALAAWRYRGRRRRELGYFSLLAAAAVGAKGTVFAVEPVPRQFETLSRNVAANGFRQASALQAAASAEEGRRASSGMTKVRPIAACPAWPGRPRRAAGSTFGRCRWISLTAACPQVDIVKIDVEGAEDAVLDGMRDGLTRRRYRALVLELHPDLLRARGVDPASCVARLRDHGYRGWTIDLGPDAYRRALNPAVDVDGLLRPLDRWQDTPWPHLLWLC